MPLLRLPKFVDLLPVPLLGFGQAGLILQALFLDLLLPSLFGFAQAGLVLRTLFLDLLLASLFYVNRQRKRLAVAQREQRRTNQLLADANEQLQGQNQALSDVNEQLHAMTDELAESNRVKEEYVGRFMRLCSVYIDKMDLFRKRVNKLIKNREYEELYNATRGQESKHQQLEELYSSFDAAFLHLFPNFVVEVNRLLQPEQQMELEKGQRMNTDLRILALIRLGIDDSSKIAEFLNYSVNTIYNYRARLKTNALVDRDNFEPLVKKIGMPQ